MIPLPITPNPVAIAFTNVEPIRFQHVRTAQLHVPPHAASQTITVFASDREGGKFYPLVDAAGRPVTIAVQPGSVVSLPDAVCACMHVALQGEKGKEFTGGLVVKVST